MNTFNQQSIKDEFDSQGYVALRGFMSAQELIELRSHLEQFIRDVIPTLRTDQVYYEDKSRPETLKQIQEMHLHDPYFARLMGEGKFPKLAALLLGDDVVGKNLQFFNKPSGVGQPTPAHQDGFYFKLDPPEAVTMWLALDIVDEENGCVRYVRGSHRQGLRAHGRTSVLGFSQGIADYGLPDDLRNEIAFPAQPGDLLVHHALTIHRADGNGSADRSRRSLGFIYYAQRAREDETTANEYQQQLHRELAAAGKI